jgi:hypothetical protein
VKITDSCHACAAPGSALAAVRARHGRVRVRSGPARTSGSGVYHSDGTLTWDFDSAGPATTPLASFPATNTPGAAWYRTLLADAVA